jgi:hypothetical protein
VADVNREGVNELLRRQRLKLIANTG